MGTLRAGPLLDLWEQAEGLPPVERALSLAASNGADPDALRSEPVGRTNAHVLALREDILGPSLAATASCPSCKEVVEFVVDTTVLRRQQPGPAGASAVSGEVTVDWRSPTPEDLIAVASEPTPEHTLRRRCLTVSRTEALEGPDQPDDVDSLSDELVEQIELAMADADPLAEVLAALTCPECRAEFESDLDLGGFVWAEVDARAKRLMHEVDVLARAYGWTEAEVLALSERRRASYLRIVLDGAP
jgi:hypothetical protein